MYVVVGCAVAVTVTVELFGTITYETTVVIGAGADVLVVMTGVGVTGAVVVVAVVDCCEDEVLCVLSTLVLEESVVLLLDVLLVLIVLVLEEVVLDGGYTELIYTALENNELELDVEVDVLSVDVDVDVVKLVEVVDEVLTTVIEAACMTGVVVGRGSIS